MKVLDWQFCPRCGTPLCKNEVPMLPLRCTADGCRFEFWNNPVPVAAALVILGEGVVLAHNRSWPPKFFSPITGFIEQGEDPAMAARREVREELGLEANRMELLGIYNYPSENQLLVAYQCHVQGEVRLSDELDDFRIVPFGRLRAWDFGTGLVVADFLRKRGEIAG